LPRGRCLPSPRCCLPRTRGGLRHAIAFFFSLCAFCHLAELLFLFFLPSFSHQARILRARQSLSTDFNASPAALQQRPRLAPRCTEEPSTLKQKDSSVRRRFWRLFSSKHAPVALVVAKKKWTILPRHHVGDIGKQLTMERQQLFTLKATTEPDDALATLKSSQHFGELQTMEKRTIYSWFSTRTMEHSLLVGFHGNRLVLWSPWQPFASSLAIAFQGPSLHRSPSDFGPGDAAREL
jgi:hypothetical protein